MGDRVTSFKYSKCVCVHAYTVRVVYHFQNGDRLEVSVLVFVSLLDDISGLLYP